MSKDGGFGTTDIFYAPQDIFLGGKLGEGPWLFSLVVHHILFHFPLKDSRSLHGQKLLVRPALTFWKHLGDQRKNGGSLRMKPCFAEISYFWPDYKAF